MRVARRSPALMVMHMCADPLPIPSSAAHPCALRRTSTDRCRRTHARAHRRMQMRRRTHPPMRTTHAAVRRRRAEAKPSQAACLQLLDPLEQLQHPEQAQKPQHRDRPAGEGHVAHEDDEEVEDVPRVTAERSGQSAVRRRLAWRSPSVGAHAMQWEACLRNLPGRFWSVRKTMISSTVK